MHAVAILEVLGHHRVELIINERSSFNGLFVVFAVGTFAVAAAQDPRLEAFTVFL